MAAEIVDIRDLRVARREAVTRFTLEARDYDCRPDLAVFEWTWRVEDREDGEQFRPSLIHIAQQLRRVANRLDSRRRAKRSGRARVRPVHGRR